MVNENVRGGEEGGAGRRGAVPGEGVDAAGGGLVYVASWVELGSGRCFQVMEAAARAGIEEWIARWSDLVEFEVIEVVASGEFWEKVMAGGGGERGEGRRLTVREVAALSLRETQAHYWPHHAIVVDATGDELTAVFDSLQPHHVVLILADLQSRGERVPAAFMARLLRRDVPIMRNLAVRSIGLVDSVPDDLLEAAAECVERDGGQRDTACMVQQLLGALAVELGGAMRRPVS